MMKKKIILLTTLATLLATLILSGISFIYVQYNLVTYSVYYAKHLPHDKNTNPEMAFILDNLDFMGNSTIKGLRFDTDGHNTIIKDQTITLRQAYDDDKMGYEIAFLKGKRKGENYSSYAFLKNGKFYYYYYQDADTRKDVYDKSDTRKKEAQAYVDEVITPIADKMAVKPKINLQWLFNRKYQNRFS